MSEFYLESYLTRQYTKLLNLEKFKENVNNINFRCPFCGDSKSSKNTRSAFILGINDNRPYFYCHRGCPAKSFDDFLRTQNYSLYMQLMNERKMNSLYIGKNEKKNEPRIKLQINQTDRNKLAQYILRCKDLPSEHHSNKYLKNRRIPSIHSDIFYLYDSPFYLYNLMFNEQKYGGKTLERKYNGVVIPAVDKNQNTIGILTRLLDNSDIRFFNLFKQDCGKDFIFGEDKCNFELPIYIVEGLFDKLSFKSNQVLAMLSSNPKVDYIKSIAKNDVTYIFDYEFMNKSLVRKINQVIKKGFKVCLWNQNIHNVKDMNELHCKYFETDEQKFDFINNNTYNKLEAIFRLKQQISSMINQQVYMR